MAFKRYMTFTIESSDGPEAKYGMLENFFDNIQFELSLYFSHRANVKANKAWQKKIDSLQGAASRASADASGSEAETKAFLESLKEYGHDTIVLQYSEATAQKYGSHIATVTEQDGSTRHVEYTCYQNMNKHPENNSHYGDVVWQGQKSQLSEARPGQPVSPAILEERNRDCCGPSYSCDSGMSYFSSGPAYR